MGDILLNFNIDDTTKNNKLKYDGITGTYYKTKEEIQEKYERLGIPFDFFHEPKTHPEMDKLENYLSENNINYNRGRHRDGFSDWDQILVYDDDRLVWDAVCHEYSYGYEQGLIEIMDHCPKGLLTEDEREYDDVLGYLTAEDIIERLEANKNEI